MAVKTAHVTPLTLYVNQGIPEKKQRSFALAYNNPNLESKFYPKPKQ